MDLSKIAPENYSTLLDEKISSYKEIFSQFQLPSVEVVSSIKEHYRMRAEFRVWHEGDDLYFYVFDQKEKKNLRTDQFLPASKVINRMMLDLLREIRGNQILRQKLFQVDFLSTSTEEILVTLLYHRKIDESWVTEAKKLKDTLAKNFKVNLIGRARNTKINLDHDYVIEELNIGGKKLIYKQIENSFTQPNAYISTKMLEWTIEATKNAKGDLLELYCGNGNFSIALAQNFRKVLATELAKPSVDSAQYNIKVNQIKNLDIIRMSAEDFSEAMNFTREFTRLKGIDLKSYECETILVDPPRSGLDKKAVELVQKYKTIIYISCNPNTLKENLIDLTETHHIEKFAMFDQFPYTEHLECGVILTRKN